MPSINLDNLERYDSKARNEAEEEYMPKDSGNWQKTEEAGAVAFYPVGGSPLEGKVKFSFKETPPASGEKGPSNPSMIAGVSAINCKRAGKNLLFPSDFSYITGRGITASVNSDGSISVSGTTSGNGILQFRLGGITTANTIKNSPFIPGLTYTVSMECPDSNVVGYGHYSTNGGVSWISLFNGFTGGQSRTFTVPAGTTGLQLWTQTTTGITLNTTVKMQCELGDTATSFEKGEVDTTTLPLNGTYYGGFIDLATGLMTVEKIGISISSVNAADAINQYGEAVFRVWPDYWGGKDILNDGTAISNTLPYSTTVNTGERFFIGAESGGRHPIYIVINSSRLDFGSAVDPSNPTAAEVRSAGIAFLTAHPMFVVATLETLQTVQLSPLALTALAQTLRHEPRLNTVYTDADTIQIGYMKSPQRTEQELTQAILEIESDDSD